MSRFKIVNVEKGEYDETKTQANPVSIQHIRKMMRDRQDQIAELNAEITYWQEKETAIMALPAFVEPGESVEPIE